MAHSFEATSQLYFHFLSLSPFPFLSPLSRFLRKYKDELEKKKGKKKEGTSRKIVDPNYVRNKLRHSPQKKTGSMDETE